MNNRPTLLAKAAFDTYIDNKQVSLYTLDAGTGLIVQVTNWGLHIVSMWCKDRLGQYEDVALGYKDIDCYTNGRCDRYVGSVVGRYANRIAKGQFAIGGTIYNTPTNSNGQSLHGGLKGLDLQVWNVDKLTDRSIDFSLLSPDGEEGFPGNLTIKVNYTVTRDNALQITYKATTDKPTVINLCNHTFFNLKGEGNGTITDHILTIHANHITPVDAQLIPTGEICAVDNTPFDFREPTIISSGIDADNEQIKVGRGYDHNWVINKHTDGVEHIIKLYEPVSGRVLDVFTDQPGVQCYTGNHFDGSMMGKYGKVFRWREGIALETQKFPDSPNHSWFPSTRLNPGETYTHTCVYRLSVR